MINVRAKGIFRAASHNYYDVAPPPPPRRFHPRLRIGLPPHRSPSHSTAAEGCCIANTEHAAQPALCGQRCRRWTGPRVEHCDSSACRRRNQPSRSSAAVWLLDAGRGGAPSGSEEVYGGARGEAAGVRRGFLFNVQDR